MRRSPTQKFIRLRGVRQNNLKNLNLDLPLHQLIVVTGPSGSGKSSLAFDTLFAEGQRRYIETFSPYARQFFDRMDKPNVDKIENIPPAIAIEQRNSVKTSRSTVGTMTEICDYMKTLWPRLAQLYCARCRRRVEPEPPQRIWTALLQSALGPAPKEVLITFDVPLSPKVSLDESLALVLSQGYQRLCAPAQPRDPQASPKVVRVDEASSFLPSSGLDHLTIVQDRVRLHESARARFIDGCEQAYRIGRGKLRLEFLEGQAPLAFSNRLHCPECDLEYKPAATGLFSFNNPSGACPVCRGFGRTISIDYNLAIPDRSKTLQEGAIKPWQTGQGQESQDDLEKVCRKRGIPLNVPFAQLSAHDQHLIIEGEPGYGESSEKEWPRAWYGVKGYFNYLQSRAYKMHVRVLLSRYRSYQECHACHGARFRPEALNFKAQTHEGRFITLADFYRLPIADAAEFISRAPLLADLPRADPLRIVRDEVFSRLSYLLAAGLGYLTLDRTTRTLSGGEAERVNLATCLGTRLVNALFVLDEPSVGLHPRDTAALVKILHRLRDHGNTVLVVEHEPAIMRAADELLDLGPGQGETGGEVIFQGPYSALLKAKRSLTGSYLSGRVSADFSRRRPVEIGDPALRLSGITLHNLEDLSVTIPLRRFVCLTGVSGSGKSTLLRDVILPVVRAHLRKPAAGKRQEFVEDASFSVLEDRPTLIETPAGPVGIAGHETLSAVVLVDQSPIGRTPRSNPAVYTGAFDFIRDLFAQTDRARERGLSSSAFSFNSAQGRCEQCGGAGFEKIEMQFLSDIFIRCSSCNGQRYRPHILEITLESSPPANAAPKTVCWNIAQLLEATIDDALVFLRSLPASRPSERAAERLALLQEVGLGYLRLGQPVTTLSGGESQRLKLVGHLAECGSPQSRNQEPILFLFDEPTTGLHFADVKILLKVFQKLVDAGHSLIVIEHNLEVINSADWIIDLGPEGGAGGGRLVAEGKPETVAACRSSYTGQALRETKLSGHGTMNWELGTIRN